MSLSQEKFGNNIDSNEKKLEYCEDIVEINSKETSLNEVLAINNQLKSVRVNIENMPIELDSILNYVGEKDFVLKNVDEIIFTPILKKNAINIETDYECLKKNIVFIKTRKESFGNRMTYKDEIDIFDGLVYESKRIESSNELIAIQKQIEVLKKFENTFYDTNTSIYLKNRITHLEQKMRFLNS